MRELAVMLNFWSVEYWTVPAMFSRVDQTTVARLLLTFCRYGLWTAVAAQAGAIAAKTQTAAAMSIALLPVNPVSPKLRWPAIILPRAWRGSARRTLVRSYSFFRYCVHDNSYNTVNFSPRGFLYRLIIAGR